MTNRDKYLKDGVDIIDFTREFGNYLNNHRGELLNKNKKEPREQLHAFLVSEVKPTLTEDEKVILRNIEFKDYIFIGRKESGDLYVNNQENDSFNGMWFIMFKKNLFQFIQPRRRI